ncbi:MAG: carbon-nitrogen hydrolase family protein [Spirochaetales bacterium]|jgi:predicted amidohydrolase|nr:carbon-nitrogen hydrolase family protein [Spirochaetales bacterium]
MGKTTRIAAIGPRPLELSQDTDPKAIVDIMIKHWQDRFAQVLPDRPDLIVVPEACDRPGGFSIEKRLAYYDVRGRQVRDFFASVAKSQRCNIIYSGARRLDDGTWRNSSEILGRDGKTVGMYNKNHIMVEETTLGGILAGSDMPVFECDFGRTSCAICFDLNFEEARNKTAAGNPQLIAFSSMYHGGLAQQIWAYFCRSYFIGAIAGPPSQIRNPFGEVIASSTNYNDFVTAEINLDYCLAHLDYNHEKFTAMKAAYGPEVDIYDPGFIGSVLITSKHPEKSALEMIQEFEIELLEDYMDRALAHRRENMEPTSSLMHH